MCVETKSLSIPTQGGLRRPASVLRTKGRECDLSPTSHWQRCSPVWSRNASEAQLGSHRHGSSKSYHRACTSAAGPARGSDHTRKAAEILCNAHIVHRGESVHILNNTRRYYLTSITHIDWNSIKISLSGFRWLNKTAQPPTSRSPAELLASAGYRSGTSNILPLSRAPTKSGADRP